MKLQYIVLVWSAVVTSALARLKCYGKEVTITDVPIHASILLNGKHICSGAIIAPYWVVTTAHCVNSKRPHSIRTGTAYRDAGGSNHNITDVIVHPNYFHNPDATVDDNDIALLFVDEPYVIGSTRQAARLANVDEKVPDKAQASVSGYGREIDGRSPIELNRVHVNVISKRRCREFRPKLKDGYFCSNRDGDKAGSCVGDTGGPLTVYGRLHGILASDTGCDPETKTVYSDIGYFRKWIQSVTKI